MKTKEGPFCTFLLATASKKKFSAALYCRKTVEGGIGKGLSPSLALVSLLFSFPLKALTRGARQQSNSSLLLPSSLLLRLSQGPLGAKEK